MLLESIRKFKFSFLLIQKMLMAFDGNISLATMIEYGEENFYSNMVFLDPLNEAHVWMSTPKG